jgi:hypothetical protein
VTGINRRLFETGNRVLRPFGFCIGRIEADFQTSVPLGPLHGLIMEALNEVWERWYDTMASARDVAIPPQVG